MLLKSRRRRDDGVTLVELLITIVILTIIIGPLTGALIVYLRNTDDVGRRLSESHDVQISAAYFAQDVQSIGVRDWSTAPFVLKQSIEQNVAATGGLYKCGTATTPNAIVRFAWDDPQTASGAAPVVRVAYFVKTVGTERQLRRMTCDDSGSVTSELVLAHNLDPSDPNPASATCAHPTTCTAAPGVPLAVTLKVVIRDPSDTGSGLTIFLTGQRRQT
jgi:prepilin-type N-terminal cleavage/methylation domain-containing protein